jgi:hypothetical protein
VIRMLGQSYRPKLKPGEEKRAEGGK